MGIHTSKGRRRRKRREKRKISNKKYKEGDDGRVVMVMAELVSSLTFRISFEMLWRCCVSFTND